jgi:hypothetical protein
MNKGKKMKRTVLLASAVMLYASNGWAGDPTAAVSDMTVSVLGVGGSANGRATGAGGVSISIPVTHSIGAQVDAALSDSYGTAGGELGTHLFTRDPDSYLVGATFELSRFGNTDAYRYGLEGELYRGDVTISANGGAQRAGANRYATTAGFGSLQTDYYITDTIKTGVSFGGYASYRAVVGEAQWQPDPSLPLSVFVDAGAAVATEHHGLVLAGVRYTFNAPGTSIKERDRHGDPAPLLQSGMTSSNLMGNTRAFQAAPAAAPVAATPAT